MSMIGLSPSGQTGYNLAQAMFQQASQPRPVRTHLEGLGQLAQALSGAYRMSEYDKERQGNLDAISAALASPEGLSSPDLVAALMGTDPMAGLGLAQANRAYGLQEQELALQQTEAEQQQAIRDQILANAGGIDNPWALLAATDGEYGPAATAYQNTPGTYAPPPGAATGAPVPAAVPGATSQPEPLLPPDQVAEAPSEEIAASIAGAASAMVPAGDRDQFERMIGQPGQDGETYEEWATVVAAMARDRFGLDWTQIRQFREQLDNEWDRLNGAPAPSSAPPQAAPTSFPPGVSFDRETGAVRTAPGPDGREWYIDAQNNPIEAVPTSPETQREIDAETRTAANVLRDEFVQQTKAFAEAEAQFNSMVRYAAQGTAASDTALIFAFFKTIDPASTVREGEFDLAAQSMGLDQAMVQSLTRLQDGTILPPEIRQAFVQTAAQSFAQRQAQAAEVAQRYTGIAEAQGIPVDQVVTFDPMRTTIPRGAGIDDIIQRYGLE